VEKPYPKINTQRANSKNIVVREKREALGEGFVRREKRTRRGGGEGYLIDWRRKLQCKQ